MLLKIVTIGDERLSQKSTEVESVDDEIRSLIKNMFETMYAANGIGLAGVQVGAMKRLFVVDVPGKIGSTKLAMINPVITEMSAEKELGGEGCLSLPGTEGEVLRSKRITVEYTDLKGKRKTLKASGLLAVCIQHEYDHLDGITFVDRLDPNERNAKIRESKKYMKQNGY